MDDPTATTATEPNPEPKEYFVSVTARPQSGPSFSFTLSSKQKFIEPIVEWFAKNSGLGEEHLKGLTITHSAGAIDPQHTPEKAGITDTSLTIDLTW